MSTEYLALCQSFDWFLVRAPKSPGEQTHACLPIYPYRFWEFVCYQGKRDMSGVSPTRYGALERWAMPGELLRVAVELFCRSSLDRHHD